MEKLENVPVKAMFVAVTTTGAYDLRQALVVDVGTEQGVGFAEASRIVIWTTMEP